MRTILFSIGFSMSLMTAVFAAGEKSAPASLKATPAGKAQPTDVSNKPSGDSNPITVKNKSSFQMDAGTRNPFWPIGWKPTGRVGAGTGQGEVPPGAFLVTTITVDGATRFAIINGKTMGEGQQFGLKLGTQIYQVTVKRIEDGQVILNRGEEEIVVPLRRK
jgi:hypothetical protein